MIKKYLLLFIIITETNLFASAPDTLWTRTYDGGNGTDRGYCLQETSDSGYIIVGENYSNVWLIKTDKNGDTLWTRAYGGIDTDIGYFVEETFDSGYIVAGKTSSSTKMWLIKTDKNGDTLWTKTFGRFGCFALDCVRETSDSGYIILGDTACNTSWLIKTDKNGDTLWTRIFHGEGYEPLKSCVEETYDGGYIVMIGVLNHIPQDYPMTWLIKTDKNGDTLWTNLIGCSANYVIENTNKEYVLAGGYYDTDTSSNKYYIFLAKIDSSGNIVFIKKYDNDEGEAQCVQQTSDGGYILAGGPVIKVDSAGNKMWSGSYGNGNAFVQQNKDDSYIILGNTGEDIRLIKIKKETGVEEPSISDFGFGNADLQIIKDKIHLSISYAIKADVKIYDLTGRLQNTVYQGALSKGNYTFTPNIHKSGIYFVRLTAVNYKETKKLILVK